MEINNIEFYTTPEGDVILKKEGEAAVVLTESNREFISSMLQIISDRYPIAFNRLMELYSKNSMNKTFYEFKVVSRFLRCNFGEYDQYRRDIDLFGNFSFEEVRCPLRGECHHEGIICKPELNTKLTDREMEVFRLIVSRMTVEDIAEQLFISKFTVIRHRENIKARLGLKDVADMVKYWYEHDLK